jgi:hypothetical protein
MPPEEPEPQGSDGRRWDGNRDEEAQSAKWG